MLRYPALTQATTPVMLAALICAAKLATVAAVIPTVTVLITKVLVVSNVGLALEAINDGVLCCHAWLPICCQLLS